MHRLKKWYVSHETIILTLVVALIIFPLYMSINYFSVGREYRTLSTQLDRSLPLVPEWEYIYIVVFIIAFAPLTVIKDKAYFRRVAAMYIAVMLTAELIFILFPVRMIRVVTPVQNFETWGLALNNYLDPPYNCFPSLHVANSFCAALTIWYVSPILGGISLLFAVLISISTLLVKQHYIADVFGGLALALLYYRVFITTFPREKASRAQSLRPRSYFTIIPIVYVLIVIAFYWLYSSGYSAPKPKWETPETVIYVQRTTDEHG